MTLKKIIIVSALATGMVFAQKKNKPEVAKPAAVAVPAKTESAVAKPVSKSSELGFTVSAYGGVSITSPKSTYQKEYESAFSAGKQEVTLISPTGGALGWFGNQQWQAGLGAGYLQTYKNVATITGTTYTYKQSYITVQAWFRYFVFQGAYAGLGAGVGIASFSQDVRSTTGALKSNVSPVITLKLGYDYDLPDFGIVVGAFVDVNYFISTATDNLSGSSADYNASHLNFAPGIMLSYKF